MPIKKVIRRPLTKSKKIVKTSDPTRKIIPKIASVSVYHNTLFKTLFESIRFQFRLINEQEQNIGGALLQFNTLTPSNKEMPLHIYDITGINTDGNTYQPLQIMKTDTNNVPYFQTFNGNLKIAGVSGGNEYNFSQSFNKNFMDHANIRLELFGRDKLKTNYKVMLIRFLDDELIPTETSNTQSQRHNAFYLSLVRPYITNRIIPQDGRTKEDLKGRYTILWSKEYSLKERTTDYDQLPRKMIKIFRKVNKLKIYNENQIQFVGNSDDANNLVENFNGANNNSGGSTTQCRTRQRLYLIIMGSMTTDINTSATGLDFTNSSDQSETRGSYNIYYETKYTIPNPTA